MSRRSGTEGFTLMEIIIAVAIVAIMAGALTPVIFHQINQARSEATTKELYGIKEGLLDFYEDIGRFPSEAEGLSALVADPGLTNWRGPYLGSGQQEPVTAVTTDAFGETYVYDLNPAVNPGGAADCIVSSFGVDRNQDMPDAGVVWVLANLENYDDHVCLVSASPLNRDKEDETADELDALADAAREYYTDLGFFPADLTDMLGGYLDGGYNNDAFEDGWKSNYLSTITGGGTPVLRIWSPGPDQQDDSGGDDDLLQEINSASL
ncbi:MAG: type II secretion system protein GspG [bacterium]